MKIEMWACLGEGRGFESRLPLQIFPQKFEALTT
jgi:hypothetical protein